MGRARHHARGGGSGGVGITGAAGKRTRFTDAIGALGPLIGLAFVWLLFAVLSGEDFVKWENQRLMLLQTAVVGTADWGYIRLREQDASREKLHELALLINEQQWGEAFVFVKHDHGPAVVDLVRELRDVFRG